MADIRQTAQLDDFTWSVFPYENPISHGGAWANVDARWNGLEGGGPTLQDNAVFANNFSWSYWTAGPFAGDIEVWGCAAGGGLGAAGEGWRLGFWTDVGGNFAADGYALAWFGNPFGNFFMRRYDNTNFTGIGGPVDPGGLPTSNLLLFRRHGAGILDGYWSGDNGANWTRVWSATDITYSGAMYLAICAEDPSFGGVGWTCFGGGPLGVNRTQFFRRPSN